MWLHTKKGCRYANLKFIARNIRILLAQFVEERQQKWRKLKNGPTTMRHLLKSYAWFACTNKNEWNWYVASNIILHRKRMKVVIFFSSDLILPHNLFLLFEKKSDPKKVWSWILHTWQVKGQTIAHTQPLTSPFKASLVMSSLKGDFYCMFH